MASTEGAEARPRPREEYGPLLLGVGLMAVAFVAVMYIPKTVWLAIFLFAAVVVAHVWAYLFLYLGLAFAVVVLRLLARVTNSLATIADAQIRMASVQESIAVSQHKTGSPGDSRGTL